MEMVQRAFFLANKLLYRNADRDVYRKDFNHCARTYDAVATRRLLGQLTEEVLAGLHLRPGMRCMDLGCGTGHATEIMARQVSPGGLVIGNDISEAMLEVAQEKLEGLDVARFIRKDMVGTLQDFPRGFADVITAFWSLEYSEPELVLKEANRVLAKEGRLALLVNTQESLGQLQRLIAKIIFRHPFVLKHVPPIKLPRDAKSFERMLKSCQDLEKSELTEGSCSLTFDTGSALTSWIESAGPCAGFRGSLKEKRRKFVFKKMQEMVDEDGGIEITFHFISYRGIRHDH